jgi:aspartyl-tRNA(Asn)/glutamyl-tRNA(Gln) amidotransferase subunit C
MFSRSLDKDMVRRVADVAHINLSEEEIERYIHQFEQILETFKELEEVEIKDTEPSFHPIKIFDIMRKDHEIKWVWDPFSNTEDKEKDYFRGPKIT